MKTITTLLLIVCLLVPTAYGQSQNDNYAVLFKSGVITPEANASKFSTASALKSLPYFDGKYYALIQFNAIPSDVQKIQIASAGIDLLSYIPHKAWIASIDEQANLSALAVLNIRSILPLTSFQKISDDLMRNGMPDYAQKVSGKVDLIVQYYKNANELNVLTALQNAGCEILQRGKNLHTYTVRINSTNGVNQLAALPFVQHIQSIGAPPTHYDTKGRSLHRSNFLNADYGAGLHYDGTGVTVATGDDGSISHIDFKGRLTDLTEFGQGTSHADMTMGILLGAGNGDPVIRGMASGSHLVLFDVLGSSLGDYPQIVNAVSNYSNYGVVVVSTSWGAGCNVIDNTTQEGDMLLHNNPQLMFCFAGANSNGSNCGYGAGTQWGNLGGGYIQGKNVTTCANLTSSGALDATSSRGPAADGRLKPDISANGTGQLSTNTNNTYQVGAGTSAASPGVAGCFAQLYQAYKSMNGGLNPDGALIKAVALNSANDLGNPGPDYKFGWGQINARRAYNTLADAHYLSSTISQGVSNTHAITVPAGTAQVKVMVYWSDVEGDPAAAKALVNNLDLTVTDPGSTALLPLVLDPTPNATTLNANAVPGVDTLNNVEQVTIDAPAAGNYTVNVTGTDVPQGPQSYYVVWEFITDAITVTYPNGGEGLVPGEQELIRWDAYGTTGTFTVEYSIDSGATYTVLTAILNAGLRQYAWTVPAAVTGQALVRVSRNASTDVNDAPFSIIGDPQNLAVEWACPDSIKLVWDTVANATSYRVYMLGALYMDSLVTITTNTNCVITGINPLDDHWFSVAAITPDATTGRKAIAINKAPGTFNCLLPNDAALSSVVSPVQGNYRDCAANAATPVSIYIRNFSLTPISNCPVSFTFDGTTYNETYSGTINTNDSALYTFTATVDLSVAGTYGFKSWVGLASDMNSYNDTTEYSLDVTASNEVQPPAMEDFELAFPPVGYQVLSSGGTITWEQRTGIIGSSGTITSAAYMNNFDYPNPGVEDRLETRVFDLTNANFNALLTFDVAYAAFDANFVDGLRVDVSNDCGPVFVPTGYLKTGLTLSTIPNYNTTANWAPLSASQWRNDSIWLNSYIGDKIMVRFVNINGYGNSLHLDNIQIQKDLPVGISELTPAQAGVNVFPNPTPGTVFIRMENFTGKVLSIKVLDTKGRELQNLKTDFSANNTFEMDLKGFSKGVYFMELRSVDGVYRVRVVVM